MNIYMIGIGGSSMSNLAMLLSALGHSVRGSDKTASGITDNLTCNGIVVSIGDGEIIDKTTDLVVYTNGVGENHKQLMQARRSGLKVVERAKMLGLVASTFDTVVAIAGTHGKTTTTGMIAAALNGKNVTVHMGGEGSRIAYDAKGRVDTHGIFLTEACEYKNSFLSIKPDIAIILNIECDHPDFYKNDEELDESFGQFCRNIAPGGLIVCGNSKATKIARNSGRRVLEVGTDLWAENIEMTSACASFDIVSKSDSGVRVNLSICGRHQITNALCTFAAAHELGAKSDDIAIGLKGFVGIPRRWQEVGEINGANVIVDYAHHPTQIQVCIDTAREIIKDKQNGRVFVLFQPHTYSRTLAFFDSFVDALSECEVVFLDEIYASREQEITITSTDLAKAVKKKAKLSKKSRNIFCEYLPKKAIIDTLRNALTNNDILLILGAGDIVDWVRFLIDTKDAAQD